MSITYWCTNCGMVFKIIVVSHKELLVKSPPQWCPFCGGEVYEDTDTEEEN